MEEFELSVPLLPLSSPKGGINFNSWIIIKLEFKPRMEISLINLLSLCYVGEQQANLDIYNSLFNN